LVAPGGDLTVDQNSDGYADGILQQTFGNTYNDWGYWFYQGTSMAAPHVSGVAALLISHGTATTPDEVRMALQSTAKDLGDSDFDPEYGWGRVDAYAALAWAPGPDTTPPVLSNGKPTGSIKNNTPTLSVTTNESATCKGSITVDTDYNSMDFTFTSNAPYTSHTYPTTALTDGRYTVYVKAIDSANNVTKTSYTFSFTVDTIAPDQVMGVKVTTVSSSALNISWEDNTAVDLDHYNIYRSTLSAFIPGPGNLVGSSTVSSYSDKNLSPATTYYYIVTAVDKAGNEGPASAKALGTTLGKKKTNSGR
jgi:serine protease